MGAKCLLRWVPNRGTSVGPEVSDLIVGQLNGFQQGGEEQHVLAPRTKWESHCHFMRQLRQKVGVQPSGGQQNANMEATGQDLVVVHLWESTGRKYLAARSDRILVEADETILEILGKMDFQSIPSSNIKFEGSRHTIGDFVVKVGAILHNEEFKGIIVEVEYFPVKYIPTAKPILAEFSKILKQHTTGLHTGRLDVVPVDFAQYDLGPHFGPSHSAVMLAVIAESIIKAG